MFNTFLFWFSGPGRMRKGRDNDMEEPVSRPSGPATLFDFLETKMPIKESKGLHILYYHT